MAQAEAKLKINPDILRKLSADSIAKYTAALTGRSPSGGQSVSQANCFRRIRESLILQKDRL